MSVTGKNFVLRTVYLEAKVDDALRDEAFARKVKKNDLINYYLKLGMKVEAERKKAELKPASKPSKPAQPPSLWEILVPTERRLQPGKFYTTKYHRVWDAKVRELTGGLTIMTPAKGQWVAPDGELFIERMIPVRILATREQIEQVIDHTLKYYDQLAVLCYRISDEVILKHAKD
jgi:hypothetical protein